MLLVLPVIFPCLVAAAAVSADAARFTGKVVTVSDGDTLQVLDDANREHTIRLAGIDAPERRQPFGTVARGRLASI